MQKLADLSAILADPNIRNALVGGGVGAISGGALGLLGGGENAGRNALIGALMGGGAGAGLGFAKQPAMNWLKGNSGGRGSGSNIETVLQQLLGDSPAASRKSRGISGGAMAGLGALGLGSAAMLHPGARGATMRTLVRSKDKGMGMLNQVKDKAKGVKNWWNNVGMPGPGQ